MAHFILLTTSETSTQIITLYNDNYMINSEQSQCTRRIHVEKAPKHNHLSAVAFALDSTFNCNLNPAPENYGTALLVFHPDVIDQTAPQFFPELCLFSHQIFQLGDEVREYLLCVILLLDECLQFQKWAMLFAIESAELLFFLRLLRLIQSDTCILLDECSIELINCHNKKRLCTMARNHNTEP